MNFLIISTAASALFFFIREAKMCQITRLLFLFFCMFMQFTNEVRKKKQVKVKFKMYSYCIFSKSKK